jgi:signal transduction histidine kinase
LRSLARELGAAAGPRVERVSDGRDWLVIALAKVEGHDVHAWSLKRLGETRDPAAEARRWWLAALVLSALTGLGGMISITVHLRRGVDTVNQGLARLESDFAHRLPEIQGDFGRISSAINQMADRRRELESTVRQQDRLAALGKVVSGVAHEIRNPLNSIRLSLELLHRRLQRGAARGEEVRGAMEEVDRLDRILARLLAFGRPSLDDRKMQPLLPLVERAAGMVRELSERKGVEVRVQWNGDEPVEADVDALQVEQVLINLLLNAIEASPAGGAVEVVIGARNGSVELRVKDQGCGIPAAIRDHVFDPYFTTKDSGNGLGLAVSREVVANHGGELGFETGERGATFLLRLPVRRSGP